MEKFTRSRECVASCKQKWNLVPSSAKKISLSLDFSEMACFKQFFCWFSKNSLVLAQLGELVASQRQFRDGQKKRQTCLADDAGRRNSTWLVMRCKSISANLTGPNPAFPVWFHAHDLDNPCVEIHSGVCWTTSEISRQGWRLKNLRSCHELNSPISARSHVAPACFAGVADVGWADADRAFACWCDGFEHR